MRYESSGSGKRVASKKLPQGSFVDSVLELKKGYLDGAESYKVINIDPAQAQFLATYPDTKPMEVAKAMPNVAPPFPGMILEGTSADRLQAEGFGRYIVIVTARPYAGAFPETSRWFEREPGWTLIFAVCVEYEGRIIRLPDVISQFVYPNGKLVTAKDGWLIEHAPVYREPIPSLPEHERQSLMTNWFLAPALFAISLTHCKGVTIKPVAPLRHHSKKVRRRREGLPRYDHHTIEIRDRKGNIANGQKLREALSSGLHIVRGHFNTYTEEAPLFGVSPGRSGYRRMFEARYLKG